MNKNDSELKNENAEKTKKQNEKKNSEKISDENENENKTNSELETNMKRLRIYSYNSRGFDQIKQNVCTELLSGIETSSILCNQENFVLKGNGHKIRQALPDHHVFIKPAKKDKLEGRPVNGMFTAIPKELKGKAKDVSPSNDRIQGVMLDEKGDSILILNVYFPADPKTKTYGGDEALENVLASIECMIQTYACNNILIAGDMNTDMKRENGRVARMEKFVSDNELELAWQIFNVDFTHEFEKD